MKNWQVRTAIGGVFALVWLLGYAMYWRERTPRPISIAAGLSDWVGDFLMLQWVDQTLGAGLLAFGAGTFVYLAARFERREADKELTRRRLQEHHANLSHTSLLADRVLMAIIRGDLGEALAVIAAMEAPLVTLSGWAPGAAHWLQLVLLEIQHASSNGNNTRRPNPTMALAYAAVAEQFFRDYERLVEPDGNYVFRPASMVAFRARLMSLGIQEISNDALPLIKRMFG